MQFLALATDYDGTLATDGKVKPATIAALERFLASGRKLIMVTGRELADLRENFDRFDLFAYIVAENGAQLYEPKTNHSILLGERPPAEFVSLLVERGVGPISTGEVIVATWEPFENEVLRVIRDMNLELQVIFNKGAVMVLPSGVNKATGLRAALEELGISRHNTVGVGDAENDHSFLTLCECGVAVQNALPSLKETASLVTVRDHGEGVVELIDSILENDLRDAFQPRPADRITLGNFGNAEEPFLLPYRSANVLVAGTSGGGKSTLVTTFLEQLVAKGYQFCVIDPEGDFETFEGAVGIGNTKEAPRMEDLTKLLKKPSHNAIVSLVAVPLEDRPSVFLSLLPKLLELRRHTGGPHWIIVDEAHHVLPVEWQHSVLNVPGKLSQMMFVTLYPRTVLPQVVKEVDICISVGDTAQEVIHEFSSIAELPSPQLPPGSMERGKAIVWERSSGTGKILSVNPPATQRQRHRRKYAEGNLPEEQSFYFRGPERKLNLRAQNLLVFVQLAKGVDDETWLHHLRSNDYAAWIRDYIKDEQLADTVESVGTESELTCEESKNLIIQAIEERYTAPAK